METDLRSTLIAWLRDDPELAENINIVAEEAPLRAVVPWIGISASASVDWSVKDRPGREIRIALELHCIGDDPATAADLVARIESRIETLPRSQAEFDIVTTQFLRARAEQRVNNIRSVLLEYRFRLLAA